MFGKFEDKKQKDLSLKWNKNLPEENPQRFPGSQGLEGYFVGNINGPGPNLVLLSFCGYKSFLFDYNLNLSSCLSPDNMATPCNILTSDFSKAALLAPPLSVQGGEAWGAL